MAEYIKHTGGSVSGKSKKPYDAMVYKDADSGYTIAVDGSGNIIKKVLSSLNTDDVVIQAAINACANGGEINITAGDYNISSSINFTNCNNLKFSGSGDYTKIHVLSDIIAFNMTASGISSYSEYNTISDFSIFLDATNTNSIITLHSSGSSSLRFNCIKSIKINNSNAGNTQWVGLELKTEDTSGLFCNSISDIFIIQYQKCGIYFNCSGNSYCNGNFFNNLTIWKPEVAIDFSDVVTPSRCNSNLFSSIQVQCYTSTTDGVLNICGSGNTFIGYEFWDWHTCSAPNYVFSFATGSSKTIVFGSQYDASSLTYLDNGSNNKVIDSSFGVVKSKNILTVSKYGSDFNSIYDALNYITDNALGNEYSIFVIGDISETNLITAKSYVHVFGVGDAKININTNTNGVGVTFSSLTRTTWQNITITRSGTVTSSSRCVRILGTTDDTVILDKVTCVNEVSGGIENHAIHIDGTSYPTVTNCKGIITSASNSSCGLYVGGSSYPSIYNCQFVGGSVTSSFGIYLDGGSNPKLFSCKSTGGSSTGGYGITIGGSSTATLDGCYIESGSTSSGSVVCNVIGNSSPKILNSTFSYKSFVGYHSFTGSNSTIQPISGNPYFIESLYVSVTVAGSGGSTLNIGTSLAGTEIASAIPTDSTGAKSFAFNRSPLLSDNPIYLTFSDTNTRATIYYSVGYNNTTNYAIYMNTYGYCRISNCKFYSNQASPAGYITTTARTAGKFLIENCSFESVGTYDLAGQTSGVVPVYNCTFARGSLSNITLPGQGTAATITAGNTYVDVTHSLASTPTKVRVTPTTNLGARSFWVDTKGATTFRININSSDVIDHTFDWEAEV